MTDAGMALIEALRKADDGNFPRNPAGTVPRILMEADVEGMTDAGRYGRNGERSTWRDGYRDRMLDSRLRRLNLRIPKLRTGSDFSPFLEARKTTEKALVSVILSEPAASPPVRDRWRTARASVRRRPRRSGQASSRTWRAGV